MNEDKIEKLFTMIYNVFIISSLIISSIVGYYIGLYTKLNLFKFIIIYISTIIFGVSAGYKLIAYIFNPYEIDFIKVLRKRCKK